MDLCMWTAAHWNSRIKMEIIYSCYRHHCADIHTQVQRRTCHSVQSKERFNEAIEEDIKN